MSAETELVAVLTNDSAVAEIVADRVSARPAQEVGLPCVTYHRAAAGAVYSQSGHSGLTFPTLYVSAWAQTYKGAKALGAAVKAALPGGWFVETENDDMDVATGDHRLLLTVRTSEGRD
jgi:hypothetical protein